MAPLRCNSCPALFTRWCDESIIIVDNFDGIADANDVDTDVSIRSRSLSCHATMDNADFATIFNVATPIGDWFEDVEAERGNLRKYATDLPEYVAAIVDGDSEDSASESSSSIPSTTDKPHEARSRSSGTDDEHYERISRTIHALVNDSNIVLREPSQIDVLSTKCVGAQRSTCDDSVAILGDKSIHKSLIIGVDRSLNRTGACISDPMSNLKKKTKLTLLDDVNTYQYTNEFKYRSHCSSDVDDTYISELSNVLVDDKYIEANARQNCIRIDFNKLSRLVLKSPTLTKAERLLLSKVLNSYNAVRINKLAYAIDSVSACTIISAYFGLIHELSLCSIMSVLFSSARLATRLTTWIVKTTNEHDSSWTAVQTLVSKTFENSDVKPFITTDGQVRWHVVPCSEYHA